MRILKKSTAVNVVIFMTSSLDHITGASGLTLTITASKNGGSFSSITPTVTDLGNGWYNLALTTSHTDTYGDLALHITASTADPTDIISNVSLNMTYMAELWQLEGLDVANPMTVTPGARAAGPINQVISGDGVTTSTVTRT